MPRTLHTVECWRRSQFLPRHASRAWRFTLEALAELGHPEAQEALKIAIKLVGPLAREPEHELRLTGFEGTLG